jgi:hypothetical protein
VLSDPDDFSRYSAVVAPNDARALAKAQINLLGLCGEWSKYADDAEPAPSLSFKPTRDEVVAIQKRMYDKSEQRRKLGMMTRNIVQKSFSGDRYLREHEQMLWIGKARKLMANRVTGDHENQHDAANVIDLSAPPDEEVITIPRSAVHSWRSSAASGMSSAFTTLSNFPMLENGRPMSVRSNSAMSGSSNDESLMRINPNRLPVFAPRENNGRLSAMSTRSGRYSALSGRESSVSGRDSIISGRGTPRAHSRPGSRTLSPAASPMLRPLRADDARLYRNSDVSMLNRDDYRGSETTSLARSG